MSITINGTTGIAGVDGSATTPAFQGTDTNTGLFYGTDIVSIATGGSERVRVDSSGNVGIGVTPSAWSTSGKTLEIGYVGSSLWTGNSADFYMSNNAYYNGAWKYGVTKPAALYEQYQNFHIWSYAASGTAGTTATFTEAMRIDSSGRVGMAKSTGLTGQLNVTNSQGFNNGTGGLPLAAIALDGNYGGGLSFIDGSQGYSLWAQTSGADFYIRRATTTGAFTGGVFINNAATSWSAASDENVKDIIEPIENAIEKVLTLRTVIGKYKDEEQGIRHPFLIAQDVEKVLPEAISVMNKGSEDECLGLSYTDTIPLLVASIKELSAKVDAQQQEINALKEANNV